MSGPTTGCNGCTPNTIQRCSPHLAPPAYVHSVRLPPGTAHRGWRTEPQYITVIYLDDEPLATTDALAPMVEERWRSAAVRPYSPDRYGP